MFVIGGGIIFLRYDLPNPLGLGLILAGIAWFLTAQTRWFASRLAIGPLRAAGLAVWALILALACFIAIIIPVALF